ncbi:hypothetical protein QNH20_12645 [Neobacillus sp. WH10]|nr:hypothetical protein [Neobacillus sp. WH10]WHY79930.1 hypothetical protein QNH20_12645 [Neobacillus sp. WH10]
MGKKSLLSSYLKKQECNHINQKFHQIDTIILDNLPKSASKHREF